MANRTIRNRLLAAAGVLAVALGTVGGGAGLATAGPSNSHPPSHESQIENLGLVKNEIKAYYGDNGDHKASPDSHYAHEAEGVEAKMVRWLRYDVHRADAKPAIVLDVDDTSLLTYTYNATHDFGYDPVTNGECVLSKCFPAVFGMVNVVKWADQHGIAVFFLTGRPNAQQDATLGNLHDVGYPDPVALFTKPTSAPYPEYLTCAPTCTTIEYKSLTRGHIESLGYDILANAGDQYSDLEGGHADRAFKLPNPMYYLP